MGVGPNSPYSREIKPAGCLRDSAGRLRCSHSVTDRFSWVGEGSVQHPGAPLPSFNYFLVALREDVEVARELEGCVGGTLSSWKASLGRAPQHAQAYCGTLYRV